VGPTTKVDKIVASVERDKRLRGCLSNVVLLELAVVEHLECKLARDLQSLKGRSLLGDGACHVGDLFQVCLAELAAVGHEELVEEPSAVAALHRQSNQKSKNKKGTYYIGGPSHSSTRSP